MASIEYLCWIGLILSLLGIGFVQLGFCAGDREGFRPDFLQPVLLAVLATVCGISNAALAVAWRDLLEHCSSPSSVRRVLHVFGVMQLAKYIPGNFFISRAGRPSARPMATRPCPC